MSDYVPFLLVGCLIGSTHASCPTTQPESRLVEVTTIINSLAKLLVIGHTCSHICYKQVSHYSNALCTGDTIAISYMPMDYGSDTCYCWTGHSGANSATDFSCDVNAKSFSFVQSAASDTCSKLTQKSKTVFTSKCVENTPPGTYMKVTFLFSWVRFLCNSDTNCVIIKRKWFLWFVLYLMTIYFVCKWFSRLLILPAVLERLDAKLVCVLLFLSLSGCHVNIRLILLVRSLALHTKGDNV